MRCSFFTLLKDVVFFMGITLFCVSNAIAGDVTFIYYDEEEVVFPGETIYLAGDFNGWNAAEFPLTDNFDGTYTLTTAIPDGLVSYKYILNDGSDNWDIFNTGNRNHTASADITIHNYRNIDIQWANLQYPATTSSNTDEDTEFIYGQVYCAGVTEQVGEGRRIQAQVGYGTDSDPELWQEWADMAYNNDNATSDEFMGKLNIAVAGTYQYATRFNGNWGTNNPNSEWAYGDADGAPYSADQSGSLIILPIPDGKLILSEIRVTPTAGEFVEVYNTSSYEIDLSDYYITDATSVTNSDYYYNIVTGANYGGGSSSDFHARFPDGAVIQSGEVQTISITGSINFFATYGVLPTYELFEDDGAADDVLDMIEAITGSISGQGGLANSGEVVILYHWDGVGNLVEDVDYAVWGDKNEAISKSSVIIDSDPYLNDTEMEFQDVIAFGSHLADNSWQRIDFTEGTQIMNGGNGLYDSDETSENLSVTWIEDVPTPGEVPIEYILTILLPGNDSISVSTEIDISFITESFTVGVDGYIKYTVNSGSAIDHLVSDPITLSKLENGSYTVILQLVDNNDIPFDPAVLDTVSFTVNVPAVSIYDIQFTDADETTYLLQEVTTSGIVTAIGNKSYFIQDGAGAWNGVFIYDPDNTPEVGDSITITGVAAEYFGLTELMEISIFITNSTENTLPDATIIETSQMDESYESVLIKIVDAECTNPDNGNGMWEISQYSQPLEVDDNMYAFTPILGTIYTVTGPGFYSLDEYKILPRDAEDIVELTVDVQAVEVQFELGLYPNPVNDKLYISTDQKEIQWSLYSLQGVALMKGKYLIIDINDICNGIYILEVNGVSRKVIIE